MKNYKVNDTFKSELDEVFLVANIEMLKNKIMQMKVGDKFDFNELDNGDTGTAYICEKLNWNDSIIILIGGYGGNTFSCYCDSETFLEGNDGDETAIDCMLKDFLNTRFIGKDELILISKND